MKKPRSGGEKVKRDAAPGEFVKSLAKSCRKDRYSCWAGERGETLKHAPPIFVGRDN